MVNQTQGPELGLGGRVGDIKERAMELAATAREQFTGKTGLMKDFIIKKPALSLGIAAGIGVVLGWLIKRR